LGATDLNYSYTYDVNTGGLTITAASPSTPSGPSGPSLPYVPFATVPLTQVIALTNLPGTGTMGDAPFTVSATGGLSGNPVTFAVSGPCTNSGIDGQIVTYTGAGTCYITASQAAGNGYPAAQPVTSQIVIGSAITGAQIPALQSQTIVFGSLPGNAQVGDGSYTLTATGSSGLPVTFTVSGPCQSSGTNGDLVTYTGAGTCYVTASQAGGNGYAAAQPVTEQFSIAAATPVHPPVALKGDAVSATVLSGSNEVTLSAGTDAVNPGQPLKLTATVVSYGSTPSGSVRFMEGKVLVGSAALHNGAASLTISTSSVGAHFFTAVYKGVSTTPIAITVGKVAPKLSIWNEQHTVRGGVGTAATCAKVTSKGPYLDGCEFVDATWSSMAGAKFTFTLSYDDGTSQTYTGTAGSNGETWQPFLVSYQPPATAKHGTPVTRGWISVVAISKDGKQAKSVGIRFAILNMNGKG